MSKAFAKTYKLKPPEWTYKRKIAKLQIKKQMEITMPVAITKLRLIPKLVNGRIELHLDGLPEGTAILHTLQVTAPVILDQQP